MYSLKYVVCMCFLCSCASFLHAEVLVGADASVVSTKEQSSAIKNTIIGSAQDWGVSDAEWQTYQHLMNGPAGKWYPQLSPPEVLGMYADNDQDKERFAELSAKEEHEKISRELVFNNAFHEAMVKLYSNEPVIKDFDISSFNPIQGKIAVHGSSMVTLTAGDHLVVFVDTTPGFDFLAMPTILNLISTHPGVSLDIYCTGNVTDADIQLWAKTNNIPLDLVQKHIITLNHDNGKLKSILGSGLLPQVVLVHQGQSQNINLASLR